KPRPYKEIMADCVTLYAQSPFMFVCFVLYIRMITRVTDIIGIGKTTSTQRGAGLRHEGIVRMMWLGINHENVFWNNINLFISVGSWKDIIQMLSYDLQFHGWHGRVLDWDKFGTIITAGLENP